MSKLTGITVEDIIEEFEACWDWDEKYRYIVDLGRKLDPLTEDQKNDESFVEGCQSQAWITAEVQKNGSGETHISFNADSDALIAKGLIAILVVVFSGKTPKEILEFNIDDLFEKLELKKHLTPIRGNGLLAMVHKIRKLAQDNA